MLQQAVCTLLLPVCNAACCCFCLCELQRAACTLLPPVCAAACCVRPAIACVCCSMLHSPCYHPWMLQHAVCTLLLPVCAAACCCFPQYVLLHAVCILAFIVIWPGFDSIARLIPAILQRDTLYDDQVPSSCCSFDRYSLDYLLRSTRLHSFNAVLSLCAMCIVLLLSLISVILNVFIILQVPLQGTAVKKISMLNKNLVHLIDDIF